MTPSTPIPGPWHIEFREHGGYDAMTGAWIIYTGTVTIATIDLADYGQEHCDYDFRSSSAEANARLIAAAPELLVALQKLRGAIDGLGMKFPYLDACKLDANNALRKATVISEVSYES